MATDYYCLFSFKLLKETPGFRILKVNHDLMSVVQEPMLRLNTFTNPAIAITNKSLFVIFSFSIKSLKAFRKQNWNGLKIIACSSRLTSSISS